MRIRADALVRKGQLASLLGRLEAADLKMDASRLMLSGGPFGATRRGNDLVVNAATGLSTSTPGLALEKGYATVSGIVPAKPTIDGLATADAAIAGYFRTKQANARDAKLHLRFQGRVSGGSKSPCVDGVVLADGQAADLSLGSISVRRPSVHAKLTRLRVFCSFPAVSIQSSGLGSFDSGSIDRVGVHIDRLAGSVVLNDLGGDVASAKSVWHAAFGGTVAPRTVMALGGRFDSPEATIKGTTSNRGLEADVTFGTHGRFGASQAARLASKVPILGAEAPYRTAMESALRGFTVEPARAHLTVTSSETKLGLEDNVVVRADSGGV